MTVEDVWRHFKQEQLEEYYSHTDEEARSSLLAGVLGIDKYRFEARDAIRLDYASYVLQFSRVQKFGSVRTASLFGIAQIVLQACTSGATFQDAEATFKKELLNVCRASPGLDTPYFSPEQVSRIGKYFADTFFSHYQLYQYCFSFDQDLTEYTETLMVETPIIPSFDGAVPENEWKAQLEEKKQQEEAAKKAEEDAEVARIERDHQEQQEREKAEAEAARQAELAKKPATLEEAVEHMVALRLEQEKIILAAEYKAKEDVLIKKIEVLETKK